LIGQICVARKKVQFDGRRRDPPDLKIPQIIQNVVIHPISNIPQIH